MRFRYFSMHKKYLGLFIGCLICILTFNPVIWQIAEAQTTPIAPPTTAAQEAALQAELNQVLQQIADQEQSLSAEQAKGVSLQRDVNILDGQINEAQLKIQARNLAIATLGNDIDAKTQAINTLTGKIEDTQQSIAQLLRQTNETDAYSIADIVLSDQDISQFFMDIDSIDSIKESIQTALGVIKQNESDTEQAREALNQQQVDQENAKISIQEQEANIKKDESQKAQLLSLSKAQQKNYQSLIASQSAKAAAIRSALFALRDTSSIPFGTALQYATEASEKTGVSPAFLLAILTQESNLGENVGSCYLSNEQTGAGVKVTTGQVVQDVMKPSRDIQPFLAITAAVGRDPLQTRVSCPIAGGGYGGAMGPSQFIPSTWVLFQNRIATALGISSPDPWNPQDAFMASALYLSDLGASSGDAVSERNAACRYYSGRACDSKKPANSFYGDEVIAKATSIQVNMIDPLQGT